MTFSFKDNKNIQKLIKHIMNIPLKLVQSDKVTEHLNVIFFIQYTKNMKYHNLKQYIFLVINNHLELQTINMIEHLVTKNPVLKVFF